MNRCLKVKPINISIEKINIMKYIQIYLVLTVFLYSFGPVDWKTENPILVYSLLLMYQVAFFFGYQSAEKCTIKKRNYLIKQNIIKYFPIIAFIAITMNAIYYMRIVKLVNNRGILDVIVASLTNPSSLYTARSAVTIASSEMFGGKFFALLVPLMGPITTSIIPLTIVFFKEFNIKSKVLSILCIFSQVLLSISSGTSEGYFNIIVFFITGMLLKDRIHSTQISRKEFKIFLSFFVLFLTFLGIFDSVMADRNRGSFSLSLGINSIDFENWMLMLLPDFLQSLLIYLTIYVTQGYYGFSLATLCDWNPTMGFGNSMYLIKNLKDLFSIDIMEYTYMGQAEAYGWGATVNWHTAYTWIANDVSLLGVVFIMYFIGWLLNQVYRDAFFNKNPIAIALFNVIIMFCFFIPANNKVFAAPQTFTTFWFCIIIWFFQHKVRF